MPVEDEDLSSDITSSTKVIGHHQPMESKQQSTPTDNVEHFPGTSKASVIEHLNDTFNSFVTSCSHPPLFMDNSTNNTGVIMVNSMAVINPTASTIFDQPIMTPALGSYSNSSEPTTVSYSVPNASTTMSTSELPVSCLIDSSIHGALVGVTEQNDQESRTVMIQDCKGVIMNPSYLSVISQPVSSDSGQSESLSITSSRPCQWQNCNRIFSNLDDLVNHVNEQHVKVDRPDCEYQCKWDNCPREGKGFNARYKMLIHIRTHTNEKPHRCSSCGKCFSRLENLKIHNRSHTGEKPYLCPFDNCNKAYSNSSDRFKHVRTHQEERPYICKMPGCNKRYTDPSSLRKHVRTHGHQFQRKKSDEDITTKSNSVSLSILQPVDGLLVASQCGDSSHLSVQTCPNPQTVLPTPLVSQPVIIQNISSQPEMQPNSFMSKNISPETNKDCVVFPETSHRNCQDGPLDLSKSPPSPKLVLKLENKDHIFDSKLDTRWPVMVTGST